MWPLPPEHGREKDEDENGERGFHEVRLSDIVEYIREGLTVDKVSIGFICYFSNISIMSRLPPQIGSGSYFLTTHFYEETPSQVARILRYRVDYSLSASDRSEQTETYP